MTTAIRTTTTAGATGRRTAAVLDVLFGTALALTSLLAGFWIAGAVQ